MADWNGLRASLEGGVTPPPLNALRERRRRRQQRKAIAATFAMVMIGSATGIAVLGQGGRGSHGEPPSAAAAAVDNFVLRADAFPAPKDHPDYVVTDVDFVSPTDGWAIGLRCVGELCDVATWHTADGGSSWGPAVPVARRVPRASFHDQNPSGGGARSLRMVDPLRGYAFNPDLYVTADGGASWERAGQPSKVSNVAVQGESVWVLERGCAMEADCDAVLLTGTVGGALAPSPLPATHGANAVLRRADATHAYVLAWHAADTPATLLAYEDGAWTRRTNPCGEAESQLLSAGAGRPMWALCDRSVFTSADRGTTWARAADLPAPGEVTDVIALSATTAYVTMQTPARLFVTHDGGSTWAVAPGTPVKTYGYGNLDVVDPMHAWAMGNAGVLWRTTDGATWQRLALPPGGPKASAPPASLPPEPATVQWTSLSFLDASRGWALGRYCGQQSTCRLVVRATADGGRTWTTLPSPPGRYDANEVTFANARDGWIYQGASTLVTHDGGHTWKPSALGRLGSVRPAGDVAWGVLCCDGEIARWQAADEHRLPVSGVDVDPIEGLVPVSEDVAYGLGRGGDGAPVLAATTDGGHTWAKRTGPCAESFHSPLAAYARGELWVLCEGEPATAMAPHRVARSADGGRSWTTSPERVEVGHVQRLWAFSATVAWRLDTGAGAAVRGTRDGGRTWTNGPFDAYIATFADATHGWALVENDVWRTTDGLRWERVAHL